MIETPYDLAVHLSKNPVAFNEILRADRKTAVYLLATKNPDSSETFVSETFSKPDFCSEETNNIILRTISAFSLLSAELGFSADNFVPHDNEPSRRLYKLLKGDHFSELTFVRSLLARGPENPRLLKEVLETSQTTFMFEELSRYMIVLQPTNWMLEFMFETVKMRVPENIDLAMAIYWRLLGKALITNDDLMLRMFNKNKELRISKLIPEKLLMGKPVDFTNALVKLLKEAGCLDDRKPLAGLFASGNPSSLHSRQRSSVTPRSSASSDLMQHQISLSTSSKDPYEEPPIDEEAFWNSKMRPQSGSRELVNDDINLFMPAHDQIDEHHQRGFDNFRGQNSGPRNPGIFDDEESSDEDDYMIRHMRDYERERLNNDLRQVQNMVNQEQRNHLGMTDAEQQVAIAVGFSENATPEQMFLATELLAIRE